MIAQLLSFVRKTRTGSVKLSESKVDPGGGANIIVEHFSSPGDDSFPLEDDIVAVLPIDRSNGEDGVAIGYADLKTDKKAEKGDKRIYARDSSGQTICEIWLKNTGDILVKNDSGLINLKADGDVNINGVIIDTSGNITAPGTISAPTITGTTDVTFNGKSSNTHTHGGVQTGGGNTGAPN